MKILTQLQKSKIAAVIGLFLVMALIVVTMIFHAPWWGFIYLFLLFMADFTHLGALMTERMNPPASRQLERVAMVCGVAGVIAVVIEAIIFSVVS